jgi:hypothetical protein
LYASQWAFDWFDKSPFRGSPPLSNRYNRQGVSVWLCLWYVIR